VVVVAAPISPILWLVTKSLKAGKANNASKSMVIAPEEYY
jgi:hypothetical protein